jgi:L-asparagine oxygenase
VRPGSEAAVISESDLDVAHFVPAWLRPLAHSITMDPHDSSHKDALDSAFLETVRALSLGAPYTFAEQYGGALVHNAMPAQGHEQEQSSRGQIRLQPHTDDGFLNPRARPEHLALLGVSNPSRIPTEVVRIDDVIPLLDPEVRERLGHPVFHFPLPESFEITKEAGPDVPARPILTAREGRAEVCLAPDTCAAPGADQSAERHLTALEEAISRAPRLQFALGPGEVLVVSNSRCLHGRPPVVSDRWIKRLYLRRDLTWLDQVAQTDRPNVYDAISAI